MTKQRANDRANARKLRQTFQAIRKSETSAVPNSDFLEVKCTFGGGGVDEIFLTFSKGEKQVAVCPIDTPTMKRLRHEMNVLLRIRSGSAHRIHGEY